MSSVVLYEERVRKHVHVSTTIQYCVPTFQERIPSSAVDVTVCLFCLLLEAFDNVQGSGGGEGAAAWREMRQ